MDKRHTEEGGEEAARQTNVVRLPRDWLGPREELVPIGAGARAESSAEPPNDPEGSWLPTAHDFWGEGSAALHDAIRAPSEPESPRTAAPVPDVAATNDGLESSPQRRLRAPRLNFEPRLPELRLPPAGRLRTWSAVAVAALTAVVVAVSIIGSSEDSTAPRAPAAAHGQPVTADVSEPARGHDASSVRELTAIRLARPVAHPAHRRRRHHSAGVPNHAAATRASTPAPSEPVEPSAAPTYATQTTGQPSTSSDSGAEAAPTQSSQGSDTSASAGGGSTQSSAPAGPSGPVSLIGSGTSPSG